MRFVLFVVVLTITALACTLSPDYKSPDEYTPDEWAATQAVFGAMQEVQVAMEAAEIDARVEAGIQPPMDNPDVKIVFAYTGENQSYHTGLRNRTSTVNYKMTGILSAAESVDGQWTGTVTGTATLKQTWSDVECPDVDDNYAIEWTIIGTPIE